MSNHAANAVHSANARAYYASQADRYHHASARGVWGFCRSRETPVVMRLTDTRRGELVLDAGCGAGHYTRALMEAGAEVHALDLLPAMVEAVRARLGVRTILGDFATAPLEPVYDKVVCAGVLEFVPDRVAALANLARALRPDGPRRLTLLILARCAPGLGFWLLRRCNGISMPMYTRRGLDHLAASARLRVVDARRAGFNWVATMTPTKLVD